MQDIQGFWNHTSLSLGDSSNIRFWEDIRIGEVPFSFLFPILYVRVLKPNCAVPSFWNRRAGVWSLNHLKPFDLSEESKLNDLLSRLAHLRPSSGCDSASWKCSPHGIYLVNSFYKFFNKGGVVWPYHKFV